MVELLTDYTTQIYHALSTDARPVADPGAQLREIDTGKRFIFDGSAWNELPDGGGGGGGEAHPYIQKFTYTQAESWMTNNPGNVANFGATYFTKGDGLYWGSIDQSYSGTYGARRFCACRSVDDTASQHASKWQRKSDNWSQNYTPTASWYIEAGATITIYFISYTDIPEVQP